MRRRRSNPLYFLVLLIGAFGLHWILVFERLIYNDSRHSILPALEARHSLYLAPSNMYVQWILRDNLDEDCYITRDSLFEQAYR